MHLDRTIEKTVSIVSKSYLNIIQGGTHSKKFLFSYLFGFKKIDTLLDHGDTSDTGIHETKPITPVLLTILTRKLRSFRKMRVV